MLTQERLKQLLEYDPGTGLFVWRQARRNKHREGASAGGPIANGYWAICADQKRYLAHRLAWFYVYGVWPTKELDHINRDKRDNRICNLREVSREENMHNKGLVSSNTSGYVGVSWNKTIKMWHAYITTNGVRTHLGWFKTPEAANDARVAAEVKYRA